MRNALTGASVLVAGALCVVLAGPALAVDEARLQRFFMLMDEDGDGFVSRPEFQTEKGAVFMTIDENGSMTLSQDEMRLSSEGFKLLAGNDGVVDGEEFIAADIASFDAIDKNQDHKLDLAELTAYVAKYSD